MGRTATAPRRSVHIVALLGIPTLALALAVTMVTTYLPVVARGFVGWRSRSSRSAAA